MLDDLIILGAQADEEVEALEKAIFNSRKGK